MLSQSRDLSGQGYCPCKTSLSTSVTSISFHLLFFFPVFQYRSVHYHKRTWDNFSQSKVKIQKQSKNTAKRGYIQQQEENSIQRDFWEIRNALNVVSTGQ